MYDLQKQSGFFLPSALANLAIKDIFVASTADALAADIISASVLWRSSSPSSYHCSEMNIGTSDRHLFPD